MHTPVQGGTKDLYRRTRLRRRIQVVTQNHIAEDVLEQYVGAKLREAEVGRVEEHLLICQRCRERAAWLDDFVSSIRSAARATSRVAAAGPRD